jgi:hypothetical protein
MDRDPFQHLLSARAAGAEQAEIENAARYGLTLEQWERVVLAPTRTPDVRPIDNRA